MHLAAADEVGEEVARPHGGELVGVAHQDEAAVVAQGGQEGPHEGHVHHGGLIHDDGVGGEGFVLVVGKDELPGVLVELGLQQPVDGGGLGAAGLA